MKFYTSVMRSEIKDQFGLEAQLADRLNAGKELMKRFAAVDERQKDALERLDSLLEEFKNAVNEETD
jgi:tRNA isopentenyl-2-thiomethyl-A-37 hydroxylase MiaE